MEEKRANILVTLRNEASAKLAQLEKQYGDVRKSLIEGASSFKAFSSISASATDAIGGAIRKTIDGMKVLAITAGVAAIALTGFGLNAAIQFESQISSIKALTGATTEQIKSVETLAMKLGEDTVFSAREAAQGIEELLKAGISLDQVMRGGAKGALDLAAAGNISVAESAEIASTVLNAFKKDALSVTDAANLLAGAANSSATDVRELKFGLSAVAAVSSGVGMSFKDTATALAVFAQNGLKGSDAGTSFKSMLLNLQPTSKEQISLFNQLGLNANEVGNLFYDNTGKVKSLAEISGVLKSKLSGLSEMQRQQALETLFGTDAIRAANILYKEGAEGINAMASEMSKFTAADVAAEKTNNFKGAVDKLKSTIETKLIQVFQKALPFLKKFVDAITDAISSINVDALIANIVTGFKIIMSVLEPVYKFLTSNTVEARGVLLGLAAVVGTVVVGAFLSMAASVIAATWPFILLAGAVAGLYIAWEKNFLGIRDIVNNVSNKVVEWFNVLKSKFQEIVNSPAVQAFLDIMGKSLVNIFNNLISTIITVWNTFQTKLLPAFQQIWTAIQPIVEVLLKVQAVMFAVWIVTLTKIVEFLSGVAGPAFEVLANIFTTIVVPAVQIVAGIIVGLWNIMLGFVSGVIGAITSLGSTIGGIFNGIGAAINGLWGLMQSAWNGIIGIFNNAVAFLTSGGGGIFGTIIAVIMSIPLLFGSIFSTAIAVFAGFIATVASLGGNIFDGVKNAAAGLVNFLSSSLQTVGNIISGWINTISTIGGNIFNGVKDAFSGLTGSAQSEFSKVANIARSKMGEVNNSINSVGDINPVVRIVADTASFLGAVAAAKAAASSAISVAVGGYASGTDSATPGLHWVGERGPELVNFRGGEKVYNAKDSRNMANGKNTTEKNININIENNNYNSSQDPNALASAIMFQLKTL